MAGIKFGDFIINGIDVSVFNGNITWSKVDCDFAGIRAGFGNTTDKKFTVNWANSKGKVKRMVYWYMDYYSSWYNSESSVFGLTDEAWGAQQAENCWNNFKNDPEGIVFLDVESGNSSYSKPLSDPESKKHAEAIAQAFLTRMDELNGKTNGIYCSIGWLSWFYKWFRNRPLWVAWYTDLVSAEDVRYSVERNGWTGPCLIWQYASDGDIDDDGVGDGISMGMTYSTLDLNAWIGTVAKYNYMFEITISTPEEPTENTTTSDVTTYKYVVSVGEDSSLLLRAKPSTDKSTILAKYYNGSSVNISEIVIGDNTQKKGWGRLAGQDAYMSMDWVKQT